jgi:hypothetical protein
VIEIHSMLPDLFLRRLEEKDMDGILRSIESARTMGDGARHILIGMRRFAGMHDAREGEIEAGVVVDAISDLVPTLGPEGCWDLLLSGASYLFTLPVSAPDVELFAPRPGERSPEFVPIALLGDAIAEGDLAEICRTAGRLIRVMHSREYFLEIVLEAVANDLSPTGRLLTFADASVKSLHQLDLETGWGIAYRLFAALSANPIAPAAPVAEGMPGVPCRAGFLASCDEAEPETEWVYLAHAFQAERYAQLRPRAIRFGLRNRIALRLFEGDAHRMDAIEGKLGPRTPRVAGGHPEAPPADVASQISREVAFGSAGVASDAAKWARTLPDVDPLYGAIAEGTLTTLAHGDPWPLLAVNAARWGAHLLDPELSATLTRRLIERLAEIRAGAAVPDPPSE